MKRGALLFAVFVAAGVFVACAEKKAPPAPGKIDAIASALATDDAAKIGEATSGLPACPKTADAAPCLGEIATALGSKKGFVREPADQAACAAVAAVLARDKRASVFGDYATWALQIKAGKGAGPDALRLATARAMAEAAPTVGRAFDDEKDFPVLLRAVAQSVPGACDTYAALGDGAAPASLPPETSAEHSACVHKHLSLRGGAGPSYGSGVFRAAEGAAALWKEMERDLRLGLANMTGPAKDAVESKLKIVEAATLKLTLKKMENPQSSQTAMAVLLEAHEDAGIHIAPRDGGADAAPSGAPIKKRLP